MCAVEPHIAHRSPTDGHDPPDHGVDELAATMTEHAVVIAGGGPTGLMLAGELALADIDVVIVERRHSGARRIRAGGLHPRTIEVLDQRGIAERFISAGQQHPVAGFAYIQLDVSDFPAPQLRAGALAAPLRAHPGGVDRRAPSPNASGRGGGQPRTGRQRR